jgi:protoheme IX farnesyltransferase
MSAKVRTADPASPALPAGNLPQALVFLQSHVKLLKLGLNALVLATTAVGFLLAGRGQPVDWLLLGWTLLGTALAAWGASAVNQWYERDRDARMTRTRTRPLPAGQLEPAYAFFLGLLLMVAGDLVLTLQTTPLAGALALLTQLVYLVWYTPLKTRSTFNTLVGAVSGALPPLIGAAAATGYLDATAWLLGAILFVWQVPHFLALAWMYREDYAHGGYVMLPNFDRSGRLTFGMILAYALLLIPLSLGLTLVGGTGWISAGLSFGLGLWLLLSAQRVQHDRSYQNARRLFLASVLYLPLLLGVFVADRSRIAPPPPGSVLLHEEYLPMAQAPAAADAPAQTGDTPDAGPGQLAAQR